MDKKSISIMGDLMNEPFTMDKMGHMGDLLDEAMSSIMSKTSNTLHYRHWKIRNVWKDYFNLVHSFDNAYTENIFYMFKTAISYHIEEMSEDETNRYISTIIETMRTIK